MGPYTHFHLAAKLTHFLQPQEPTEYFWGAIIPDIRYLAHMRRADTHLGQARLQELAACYPHLGSFLLGYRVHCLIDEIDVMREVGRVFPLNLLKPLMGKNFSQQQATMLVELYFLKNAVVKGALSGSHNEVLQDLGITLQQTGTFFAAMQEYFLSRSFDGAFSAFQKIGMIENARVDKYIHAYQSMQRNAWMQAFFLASVTNARLERRAIHHVRQGIRLV